MKFKIPKLSSFLYYFKFYLEKSIQSLKNFYHSILIIIWFRIIKIKKPLVILGGNVETYGGVHHHLHAIKFFSNSNISFIPSNFILNALGIRKFQSRFLDKITYTGFRVVHSHVYPWMIYWCKNQKLKNKNIKWIHTYHAHYYPEYSPGKFLDWQKEFNRVFVEVASHADVKISVSKWQQRVYKEDFNIDTIYLPNGVNVLQCDKVNKEYFIKRFNLHNFILNVSGHDPVKNPKEFIKLAQSLPKYHFVIIGKDLSKELFIENYKIKPPANLSIFGLMPQKEVQMAIAACSCLVSNSRREGLPTLILEAMTHEKPIVVSNEPGSMEAIDHGSYGYFYELGNLEDLKEKTLLAINDTEIGAKARQRVLNEYDWRVVAKKLDIIYKGNVQQ